ncbi:MAG: carboxypeptidase-like regulatory domain-containing protein, partial [Candidatus Diapherotrites archaeon]
MGLFDFIKDLYYSAEDKYYEFLDGVNEKVRIYEIIDPIDKVIPSFLLFVFLFLLLVALAIAGFFGFFAQPQDVLSITINDKEGKPVEGASITFLSSGKTLLETKSDEKGKALLKGIKEGDRIIVRVSKEKFATLESTIIVEELPFSKILMLEAEEQAISERNIRIVDALGQPIATNLRITFRCSESFAKTPEPIDLTPADRGQAKVNVPNNCGRLTATITDDARFREITNYVIAGSETTIRLSEVPAQKARLIVNVVDQSSKPIDGITIEIYKAMEQGIGPINGSISASGKAEFEETPGEYLVKTYDRAGIYGEAERRVSLTSAGETITISLREEIKGKISIKVVDKRNGQAIANANVKLVIASNESVVFTDKTNSNGIVEFSVSRDTEYKAGVSANDYQSKIVSGLRISNEQTKVELEKCTPTTCGTLKVKVVDQDNMPIHNAIVSLFDAATGKISLRHDPRRTDINGIAKFQSVGAGNYWAFAFKETYSGKSDTKYFNGTSDAEALFTITMDLGESVVRVIARDKEGFPIPFSKVTLFDARSNRAIVGPEYTDFNGVLEKQVKAGSRVYALIVKDDEEIYAPYTTAKVPLIANEVTEFLAVLEKPILNKGIQVDFEGLYLGNKKVTNVEPKGKYIAKFKVRVPENKDYKRAVMHIRTGSDVIMEKDKIYLGEVNAPNTRQIRATSFEPEESGKEVNDYDVTVDDAKWVNLEWNNIMGGIYEVKAEVNIKDNAAFGEKLFLNYKIYAEYDSKIERDPEDKSVTKELYSNTKQEILEVGAVTLCDEFFCFTGAITDIDNDIIAPITETYNAKIFNKYKLQFAIKNNSSNVIHNNANLRIKNPDETIKFFEYQITDAETRTRRGTLNAYEFPRFDVGNLSPDKSIRLETDFVPQKALNGIINIVLVSDQKIVYEKNLTIITSAIKEMQVELDKRFFSAGIPTDIEVIVKDQSQGTEIEGAVVRILDARKNVVDFAITNKSGKATITLPGQKPGDKLKIQVEKADYNLKEIEVVVSDKLIEVTPQNLGITLNTKTKLESSDKVNLRNVSPFDLTIKQISLKGNFKKIIDTAKIRNWLESSYKGMEIKAEDKTELIVKTFLTQDALAMTKRENIEAELFILVANGSNEWTFSVPVKIAVGLGEEVDDPTCLVISKSEWITSTTGTPKRTEFQIQNNCTSNNKPIAIHDLEAKVNWKTNQIGEYRLNIGADETILRPGYFRILLGTLQPEQTLTAILSFTPYGGINGVGEAEIVIQATNPLEAEDQVLENKIKTKITAVSLSQCITFDKEIAVVNQNEKTTFTITATEQCGQKVDFELESELKTTPTEKFSLQPGESKTIEVFAEQNNPGQYPLYLNPKFGDDKRTQLLKALKVIVNAPGCWQMSKYEFDVYDDTQNPFDGKDSAKLTNFCIERPVEVKVNTKDFLDALQDGIAWGAISAGLVMLTNWPDPNYDVWGRPTNPETGEVIQQRQTAANSRTGNFFLVSNTTGFNTVVSGAASGMAQGLVGTVFNSGKGLVRGIFGTSPLAAGLFGTVVGTLMSYSSQDKETTFTLLAKDTEITNLKLTQGKTINDKEDEKIKLEVEGFGTKEEEVATVPQPLTKNENLLSQGIKTYKTIFTNDSGLITTEERPYYSNLIVKGTRHKYKDKTYDKKDFYNETGGFLGFFDSSSLDKQKSPLEEEKGQSLEQTYKLEFNSVPPLIETQQDIGLLNCQDGTRIGKTGEDALPKIKLDWSWGSIKENECNENNPNGIYCDATQFSIALLKKINILNQFLADNGPSFQCPSPRENEPTTNTINEFDVGISSLSVVKKGNDVEIVAEIKNTNLAQIETEVRITATSLADNRQYNCTAQNYKATITGSGTQEVKCTLTNLPQGFYTARAQITPRIACENCEDLTATNTLTRNFFAGESGLEQCEPYSTTRLAEFMQASGIKNSNIIELTNFNALLMVDGYSSDFQHDFDVSSNNTFFQAPEFYTDKRIGLGNYFRNPQLFTFD